MRLPKPQHEKGGGEYEKPHHRLDANQGGVKVTPAHDDRQNVMPGDADPGHDRHRNADRNDASQDRWANRSRYFGAAILLYQQRVAEHEKRKSTMPDYVEPGSC